MNSELPAALDAARRIADGEAVDLGPLESSHPSLARGLRKLGMLAKAMQLGSAVGSTWGHLQRLELAGQGGFGEVFRAYDPTLDRTVALKLKREDSVGAVASGRDFVAEARRLARVRHAHVLAVHGASYHDGRAGIWADWIDGETLAARLQRDGPLAGGELLRVLCELAEAIEAVHAAGLVHGDIKASNVMLDGGGRLILMDFGAGFESSEEGSAISAGTPRYLAPEVQAGGLATLAVDLYAFGELAHLLATATHTQSGVVANDLRPRPLRQLLSRMLDPEPAARPRAGDIRRALQRLQDAPQRRLRQTMWTSVLLGLIGIVIATSLGIWREQAQRHLAERARDEAQATSTFLTEMLAAPSPEMSGRDVRVVDVLAAAAERAEAANELSPATRAALLSTIGRSQLALSHFSAADASLSAALALDTPANALSAEQALRIGLSLVDARMHREQDAAARALLERVATDPRWQGDAAAVAEIDIQRGQLQQSEGKLDAALRTLAPYLSASATVPPALRLRALRNQADILFEQRQIPATEKVLREALALSAHLGRRGSNLEYDLRMMLSNTLNEQGRFVEAEASYRALVVWAETAYGEGSLPSLAAWGSVANTLNSQGRFAETQQLLENLLPKIEKLTGADGGMALGVRSNLASAMFQNGQLDAALVAYDQLIASDQKHFGPAHPQTLIDRFNRVEALNTAGRNAEALLAGEQLRTDMTAAMGAEHLFTLETEDAIGFAMTALGRALEAEALHREIWRRKSVAIGADNPYTLLSHEYLARALIAQRRFAEARSELAAVLTDRLRVLGAEHPKTVQTKTLLDALPKP